MTFVRLTAQQYHDRARRGWITRKANGNGKNPASNWLNKRADGSFKVSRRHKYNARGRWIGEHFFPSKAEADRCDQLAELMEMGTIAELELQPAFPCVVNGKLVCTYRADFRYLINPGRLGQRRLTEDVKGVITGEYRLKRKLLAALHPEIEIIELKVPRRGNVSRFRYLTADQFRGATEKWRDNEPVDTGTPGRARKKGGRARAKSRAAKKFRQVDADG